MTTSTIIPNYMISCSSLLTNKDIDSICQLVKQAGKLAQYMYRSLSVKHKSGPDDLVTNADLAVSQLILSELDRWFPADFVISEEDVANINWTKQLENKRVWLVDPIDGTDNYVNGDGQYAIMIGLLVEGRPEFGWVYIPALDTMYYGGPRYGCWLQSADKEAESVVDQFQNTLGSCVRLAIGWRDHKANPWIKSLPDIQCIPSGSVGVKVVKILENQADIFVHLSGKLKVWDTAGPVAIALACGMEAGTLQEDVLSYSLPELQHQTSVVIGRVGACAWARKTFINNSK